MLLGHHHTLTNNIHLLAHILIKMYNTIVPETSISISFVTYVSDLFNDTEPVCNVTAWGTLISIYVLCPNIGVEGLESINN